MPKWAKWLLVGCGSVLLLAIVGFALFAGWVSKTQRDWHASASVEIAAPPSAVAAELADLTHWPTWSAWARDTGDDYTRTYSGPARGPGASMQWLEREAPQTIHVGPNRLRQRSNPVSRGTVRITAANGDSGVELETVFQGAMVLASHVRDASATTSSRTSVHLNGRDFVVPGRIQLEPTAAGTRVTWTEDGDIGDGFAAGLLALAMRGTLEDQHAQILATSLERLKKQLEAPR